MPRFFQVPLASVCPGEFKTTELKACVAQVASQKGNNLQQNIRAFLHGNFYSHRDLYIQVARTFKSLMELEHRTTTAQSV